VLNRSKHLKNRAIWALNRAQRRKTERPEQPTSRRPTAVRHVSWAGRLQRTPTRAHPRLGWQPTGLRRVAGVVGSRARLRTRVRSAVANRGPPRRPAGGDSRTPACALWCWALTSGGLPCGASWFAPARVAYGQTGRWRHADVGVTSAPYIILSFYTLHPNSNAYK
jgi:hypothetical protein